jgi:hypothetical protein
MSETKRLNEYPYYPYPSDGPTRFGFIVGDIVAWAIIVGMVLIPLKSVLHF